MKRFYCTVCKKIKRVRRVPTIIDNLDSPNPDTRLGECDYHSAPKVLTFKTLPPAQFPTVQEFTKRFDKKKGKK